MIGPALPAHVYVHVPFCRSKCSYCDFFSVVAPDESLLDAVGARLELELALWGSAGLPGQIRSVYFGGGTPTLLAERLPELLRRAQEVLPLTANAEITVEANPDSLEAAFVEDLASAGVTRVSLGAQSFDPTTLHLLGRTHRAEATLEAATGITRSGIDLSLDLICGVPGLSDDEWRRTLEFAVSSGAGHISVYPLTLEPERSLAGGEDHDACDPDSAADQMLIAEEFLAESGLRRYEVANYALPGRESVHNLAYWQGRQYLGLGPSACGMLDSQTALHAGMLHADAATNVARVRYCQTHSIDAWLDGGLPQIELLDQLEAAREDLMMGLRLTEGVAADRFAHAGLAPVLDELLAERLLESFDAEDGPRVRTTRDGWLLGNEVFSRVWNAN